MTYQEVLEMVEQGVRHLSSQGKTPTRVCMNAEMAAVVQADTIKGLDIKIINALQDGKVIVE